MADEDDTPELKLLDQGLNVCSQTENAPVLAVLARFPVPRLIDCNNTVAARELIDLVVPPGAITAPAVKEDEGGVALSTNIVDDTHTVAGADRRPGRGGLTRQGHWD